MNGVAVHAAKDDSNATQPKDETMKTAATLPIVLDLVEPGDPDIFIITTPKGGCSITYDPPSILPAVSSFSSDMFELTAHRCHPYVIRPKGDRGPSGEGWTGFYLRVDPIYDPADRERIEEEGGRGWSMSVEKDAVEALKEGLVITASDEVCFALYVNTYSRFAELRWPLHMRCF